LRGALYSEKKKTNIKKKGIPRPSRKLLNKKLDYKEQAICSEGKKIKSGRDPAPGLLIAQMAFLRGGGDSRRKESLRQAKIPQEASHKEKNRRLKKVRHQRFQGSLGVQQPCLEDYGNRRKKPTPGKDPTQLVKTDESGKNSKKYSFGEGTLSP